MNGSDENKPCGNGSTSRRPVLVLVLGLLGVLVMFVTVNAYVAQKTEDSLVDFDSGTFIYTGLLDIPDDGIHSVQLLPIGLTGEWQTSGQPLPRRLANLAAITNGDTIYVVGGTDLSNVARPEVYSSRITGLGGELTPWQTEQALPTGKAGVGLATRRLNQESSTLYVVGGADSSWNAADTVLRAQANNETGEVDAWVTDGVHVPHPLYYASVVEHGGALYVIGGFGGIANAVPFAQTYYATIKPDGSLNPFVETLALPEPLYNGYAVVYDGDITDTLYFIGGIGGTEELTSTFKVYFADFLPDGRLTDWTLSKGNLPIHLYAHSGVLVHKSEILVTGGLADDLNPSTGISSTVKAALVDPDNPSFRLYDWCRGVEPPTCTIGAWQTGKLLPEVRALHGTAAGHGFIYVIGGEDGSQKPRDTVFFGTVNGVGALYSPEGLYRSNEIDLEQPATLRRLDWQTTIGHPTEMGLSLQYRTSVDAQTWSPWSEPVASQDGLNQMVPDPPPSAFRYLQYQANFTTAVSNASPLLDEVHIYYEVPDPDLTVAKDSGTVITAALGSTLQYTIYYTNTGGWLAENAVLTETLPEHTTYVDSPGWHAVGSSNVYTYRLGTVERGADGNVPFQVRVDSEVPPGTYYITNRVDINYPPMLDAFEQQVVDPFPDDNWDEFSNPLSFFALAIAKDAEPPPGSTVDPGSLITYSLRYSNVGAVWASPLVLTDTFDPLGDYTVISPAYIPPTASEYVWDLPGLPPRQTREITIVVQLDDPMPNHWLVTNTASLFSPQGEPYHTPVIAHPVMNYSGGSPSPMVDLAVTDVHWVPSEPTSGTWPVFYATVVNSGTADAEVPFWLELYIKPQPSDPPRWPDDDERGYCLGGCTITRDGYRAYVQGLAATESKSVTFANLAQYPSPDFPAAGSYDVYVQVDVALEGDNPYWGAIAEDYETNNIRYGFLEVSAEEPPDGPPKVYLPIVLKNRR